MHYYKKHLKELIYGEKALSMVELLIATVVAVLVATGAYSLYFTVLQSWERGVIIKENQQNARMAIRAIEQDIRYADWIWVGEDWEKHWKNDQEPGEGEQLYYSFFADTGEQRPNFTFRRIWLGNEKTLYLRKSTLLTELNSIYHINTSPFPLADNIQEIKFQYADETKKRVTITIKAGDTEAEQVELRSSILIRNLLGEGDRSFVPGGGL